MTGRAYAQQLAAFLASLAFTLGVFSFGWLTGSLDSGNFNNDVILDPSQVEFRPPVHLLAR